MASKKKAKQASRGGRAKGTAAKAPAKAKKASAKSKKSVSPKVAAAKKTTGAKKKAKAAPASAKRKAKPAGKVASSGKSTAASKAKAKPTSVAKPAKGAKPASAAKAAARKAPARAGAKKPAERAVKVATLTPAAPTSVLDVGAAAPAFTLQDQAGLSVSSADFAGKPYVLYFYPKDDTPGCTREACDFRDEHQAFRDAGIAVLAVSPDSTKSHKSFADKYSLPFRLLSDPDKVLSSAYGAWGAKKNYGKEYMGIIRSTFLVGADGRVQAAYRGVKVDGHVQKVFARATEGAA